MFNRCFSRRICINFRAMRRKIFQKYDLKKILEERIMSNGGWVNTHCHLDRAFTLNEKNFHLSNAELMEKWYLNDELKRTSTVTNIYDRMAYAIEDQIAQGVQAICTFIDVDEIIEDKSILAAQKIKETFHGSVELKFVNQTLKGVIEPTANYWFEIGASFVDIIGGLPKKDAGHESEHLDILFQTAKKMNKMLHVHVDQFNSMEEKETELLAQKTIEYGMQGKVAAIHGVSIGAHPIWYRKELYRLLKKAGVMMVVCPTAWIDSRRTETLSVTHNSIAPVDELVPEDILVSIGTDNISDIYKPFSDGNMWTELKFLLESCHFYDLEKLVAIATQNGRKAIGLTEEQTEESEEFEKTEIKENIIIKA